MLWRIHWLEAEGVIGPRREVIGREIVAAELALSAVMPVAPLDVLVAARPRAAVMDNGLGGSAYGPSMIVVSCDLTHPLLDASLADGAMRRLAAHEAHHALRMAGPGYGQTLGEALVREGLAGCAVRLALGSAPEPWEQASDTQDDLSHLPDPVTLTATDYDHAEWFFGTGHLPRWRGYRLGRLLAERWAERTGPSGATWINVPADEVIKEATLQDER